MTNAYFNTILIFYKNIIMKDENYWEYEAIVMEKNNKERIYLYPDDKNTDKPMWLACESSARLLQKLMPEIKLCTEYWKYVDKTVVVVRNIDLKDALKNKNLTPTSHVHCLEIKFNQKKHKPIT